jgi:hypothetical protein
MDTKEKTYTFRAPDDLAARTREAFVTWRDLLAADDEGAFRDAMSGFCLAVARRARSLDALDNQSELFRSTFELFVEATEKAVQDREFVRAYEEWAQADDEVAAVREGALEAAADRWRDE